MGMLDGRVIVVSGGTQGLGEATVRAVVREGAAFKVTRVLRGEAPFVWEILLSAGVSLALGVLLAWIAGKLYEREAILG